MNRLLLYVHFNKYDKLSPHVLFQLTQLRPLFSRIVFISNSQLSSDVGHELTAKGLANNIVQRDNVGFDFAAWRDGLSSVGFDQLSTYDSVTLMNDTCFGPLWDLAPTYEKFEQATDIDFWGMTNHRQTKQFPEHLQSYFLVFKQAVPASSAFQSFWSDIEDFDNVADVIEHYETQVTTSLQQAGFRYGAVFDTVKEDATSLPHPDFSYYHPTAILNQRVPFLKVKAFAGNQHIAPYLLQMIEHLTTYDVSLIIRHMSDIDFPDFPYLLGQKMLRLETINKQPILGKVAVHLHVFYVDLLAEFWIVFGNWSFNYDLYITTDTEAKVVEIRDILSSFKQQADIVVTGNQGRDIIPMLKLKKQLAAYDYVGHFHTKKSREADFLVGESWRKELQDTLIKPADVLLTVLQERSDLGLVIADIPSFFRYNKVVNAWDEHLIAPLMNELWEAMDVKKTINFKAMPNFVMSYGTFVWFKYDALAPLFELDLDSLVIPQEPLPQNSILHAMERILIYLAWDRHYDFAIAPSPVSLTAFMDNKLLNTSGSTYVNFDAMGGIKGALAYLIIGPARAICYIYRRIRQEVLGYFEKRNHNQ